MGQKKTAKTARPTADDKKAASRKAPASVRAQPEPEVPAKAKPRVSSRDMAGLKEQLLAMRERLVTQIEALKDDSLRRDDEVNTEEDGTDAFDRQFALDLATSEQDAVVQIDESLRRIEEGRYGVCEECAGAIEAPRLKALPFVRTCIACQSQLENGRGARPVGRARL